MPATCVRTRTSSRAQAEAVCRHYLSNGAAQAATGWSATSATRRAARCSSGSASRRQGAGRQMDRRRDRRAWRPARRHPRELAASSTSTTSPTRHGAFSACRVPSSDSRRSPTRPLRRPDRPKPRGGSSPCRSRLRARSWRRICANAALRLCTEPAACASIRAATIGRTTHLPTETWPAMIAAVTDLDGRITGAHRTWLDPDGLTGSRQGADRHAATGDGRSPRQRGPLRRRATT